MKLTLFEINDTQKWAYRHLIFGNGYLVMAKDR